MTVTDIDGLCRRATAGDRRALARLISVMERSAVDAEAVLTRIYPHRGALHVCGLTGPPGAGKSTLVWPLASAFQAAGRRVAVLAVDPSSPKTGGALLGDRVRQPAGAAGIFFRSMSNRARPGALTPLLRDVLALLEASGFDVVLIETVGAGQADVGIEAVAHTVVVVQVPGLGDDVQALKAGILEIGHVIAVNKADLPGADALASLLRRTLELSESPEGAWRVPVVKTSALRGEGIDVLADHVDAHLRWLEATSRRETVRARHAEEALREALAAELQKAAAAIEADAAWREHRDALLKGALTPADAARRLLDRCLSRPPGQVAL